MKELPGFITVRDLNTGQQGNDTASGRSLELIGRARKPDPCWCKSAEIAAGKGLYKYNIFDK